MEKTKQFTWKLVAIGLVIVAVNAPAALNVVVGDGSIITSFDNSKFCTDGFTGAITSDVLVSVEDMHTVFNVNKFVAGTDAYLPSNDSTLVVAKNVISVPEPSTIIASILMLLPLGVSAIRIIRRKHAVE